MCIAKSFKVVDFFIFYRKHAFRDELEAHRRDLEVLRSRVCKYSEDSIGKLRLNLRIKPWINVRRSSLYIKGPFY